MAAVPAYRRTFFRLLGFLRPYKWGLAVSVVLAVGSQAAAVVMGFLTGDALQEVRFSESGRTLWLIAGAILVTGLARALFMMGRRLIAGRQALGIEYDMRNALYAKLLRLSFGFYDRHQTGQLMSRATVDLQAVRFFLGYGLIFFFQHVVTIVGVTAVMFFINWRLALAATAITPFIVVLAYRYSSVSHPVLRDVQQKMADVATVAEENIVGVHVVKAFAQEGAEQDKFARRSEDVFGRSVEANRQRALYVPLLSFLPIIAQATVLLLGGRMVANGTLAFGQFVAFNIFVVMLVMPLRMLGMWIGQMQRATASGERIFEVIDEPEEVTEKPDAIELPPGEGRVRFERVSFEYAPGRRGARRHRPRARARPHGRAHRAHRLGQDDARLPDPSLLRRDRGPGDRRRRGRARREDRRRSGTRSRSSRRTRSSSRPPSSRTSPSASPAPRRKRSSTPPGWRRRTSSSSSSPTATRPSSASAESRSAAASASASRSPER